MTLGFKVSSNYILIMYNTECLYMYFLYLYTVPAPSLISNFSSPIRPGFDVTLTCTVILRSGPEIDIPLTVTMLLSRTDPAGSPLTTTTPSMSGSTYTSTAMVSSFRRDQSGNYTCTATVSSTSPNSFLTVSSGSDIIRVTVGESDDDEYAQFIYHMQVFIFH